ncbi:MAG: radical SAM/SPASM domain-containing protein [Candidatus Thorarchaeota archaeon]
MINKIHIQTIDCCNAKCLMCPYKSLNHTGNLIDDSLFNKILNDISFSIKVNLIAKNVEIFPFQFNEPFLDIKFFERLSLIKKIIPDSKIIVFTNGLLLERYYDKIIKSDISLLYISLYGCDAKSFNKVTQLSINQEKYNSMIKTINYIKRYKNVTIAQSWKKDNQNELNIYSSRAGFYTKNLLHSKITGCKWKRNYGWLNITDTGEVILCCMDWNKEIILGDLKRQSIRDVLSSDIYKKTFYKTIGKTDSDNNFICKRCEYADSFPLKTNQYYIEKKLVQSIDNNNITTQEEKIQTYTRKYLIVTAANDFRENFLLDFLLSLRTKGSYNGEILVIDYGISQYFKELVSDLNINFVPTQYKYGKLINNVRFLDLREILLEKYNNYTIAMFDADIWFNQKISGLFDKIESIEGCLFATEHRPAFFTFGRGRGPKDTKTDEKNLEKMTRFVSNFDGHINIGLLAGKYKSIIDKLDNYFYKTSVGYNIETQGQDQYLMNLLFDFEKDSVEGKSWNCVLRDVLLLNDNYYMKLYKKDHLEKAEHERGDEIVGIHCYGIFTNEQQKQYRFSYLNNKIITDYIAKQIDKEISKLYKTFIQVYHSQREKYYKDPCKELGVE